MAIALPSYATTMNLEFDGVDENVIVLYSGDGSLSDPDIVLRWDNLSETGKQEILDAFASTGGTALDSSGAFTDSPANPSFTLDFGASSFDPAVTLLKDVLPSSYLVVAPSIQLDLVQDLTDGSEATGLANDSTVFDLTIEVVDSEDTTVFSAGPVDSTGDSLQTYADVIALIKTAEASFVEDFESDLMTSGEIDGLVAGETYTVNLTGTLASALGLTATVVGGQGADSTLNLTVSYASRVYSISSTISETDTLNTFLEEVDRSWVVTNGDSSSVSVAVTDFDTPVSNHKVIISGNLVKELQRNIDDGVISVSIPTFALTGLDALKSYRTSSGSNAYTKYEKLLTKVADMPTDSQYRTSASRSGLRVYFDRSDSGTVVVEYEGLELGTLPRNPQ